MKKILLWIFIPLFSLIVLLTGAIAFALNFIFTPEKLTPLVERVANDNLDARLSLRSVELTFFSTFPNFSLAIDGGALLTKIVDTTMMNDTIVSFDRVNIAVNPIALLKNNEIVVHQIALLKPRIYAGVRADGAANWDVFGTSKDTTSVADTSAKTALKMTLSDIRIENGSFTFDDRASQLYTTLQDVTMTLGGDLSAEMADVSLRLSFRNGLVWERGELIFKGIDLTTNASMGIDTTTKRLVVRQSEVELNNIKLTIDGNITPDSVAMKLALKAPSLATVLDLLPLKKEMAKLSSTGSVDFAATISGMYKGGNVPVVDATLAVVNATARYAGFRYGVDNLTIRAAAHLDMSRRTGSYVNIEQFNFKGASTMINLNGRIANLLSGNPSLNFKTTSRLNLTELAETFPLEDSVVVAGVFEINGEGSVNAEQLRRGDYASISAAASVDMQGVRFAFGKKIESKFDALRIEANNNSEGMLAVKGAVRALNIDTPRLKSSLSAVDFNLEGVRNTQDSSSYLRGVVTYKALESVTRGDSVVVRSGRSSAEVSLSKVVDVNLETDSLALQVLNSRFAMRGARIKGSLTKDGYSGKIGFEGVDVSTALFPLPMSMAATVISVKDHNVILHKAEFKIGDSDVIITGHILNLISASLGEKPLTVRVDLSSDNLNLTQIIHTLNAMERGGESSTAETTAQSELVLFKIHPNIDFELNTQISKLEFGVLSLNDIHGAVSLKNGVARLDGLSFTTLGARLVSKMVYDSRDSDSTAKVGMTLASRSIDVHSVIGLIPSLDTIVPMLNSFEGKVDFSMIADARLGEGFVLNPKDIRAVVSFSGENLVLLDGQTFAEISKMLMFKNKQRNVVDSVAVQLSIHEGTVEVFPFIIQLDRYRAAVGGQHYFDNNFDYHISVLKSPIPFKFGINISGSLDKMKVGIGKTQYKFLNEPSSTKQLNPKFVELGKEITSAIKKL